MIQSSTGACGSCGDYAIAAAESTKSCAFPTEACCRIVAASLSPLIQRMESVGTMSDLRLNQAMPNGVTDEIGDRVKPKFLQDVRAMRFGSAQTDSECPCDLFIAFAFGE